MSMPPTRSVCIASENGASLRTVAVDRQTVGAAMPATRHRKLAATALRRIECEVTKR
jgi:hypothetical protein